jgi:hypothetical protein
MPPAPPSPARSPESRVGLCNTRHADTSVRPGGLHEAGVDTLKLAAYLAPGSLAGLAELPYTRTGGGGLLMHDASGTDDLLPGWRTLLYPQHGMVAVEGHPSGLRGVLAAPADLPALGQLPFDQLRALGVRHGARVASRIDCTATLRFDDPLQGVAFLMAVASVRFPGQKPEVIGYPPETVYGLAVNGRGRKLWRCYDSGLAYGTAERGVLVRLEDQWRPARHDRPSLEALGPNVIRDRFERRFATLWRAGQAQKVVTMPALATELHELVRRDQLDFRGAERMLGYCTFEALGAVDAIYPERQARRRRSEARSLGLMASEVLEPVEVDLAAILSRALGSDAWGAAG